MNNRLSQIQHAVDTLILMFILLFISVFLDARLIFIDTIPTGGDTASWYQIATYLKDHLIPCGRLYGWDMGNFCGYPNFNFYFIPPFLFPVLLSYVGLPLTIGLKLSMASGWYILPLSVYFGLRLMSYRFPAPILGAAAMLLFLFNESYTMFGGNILSTLAGEFCYMFAFSLLPYFMGSMINGFSTNTRIKRNGLLLGLIGLSHLFVFIPAIAVILYGFFSKKRTGYIIQVCAIGFGLMAFWILPLIAWRQDYTIPVYMIWQGFTSLKMTLMASAILFIILAPLVVFQKRLTAHLNKFRGIVHFTGILCIVSIILLAGYGLFQTIGTEIQLAALSSVSGWIVLIVWTIWLAGIVFFTPLGQKACQQYYDNQLEPGLYFWMIWLCITMYFCAHFLKVPDIRFLPPILLMMCMIVFSFYVGQYLSAWPTNGQVITVLFILLSIVMIVIGNEHQSTKWYTDTFKGYEHTRKYGDLKQLTRYLQETEKDPLNAPRVGYEKCNRYSPYGGDRVFESLHLFSGRQTLEGIHYSSSLASKFITFLQTEFSKDIKTPTPYILSKIDPNALAIHMKMVNMSQIILLSPSVKDIFDNARQFIHEKDVGAFSLFRLKQEMPGYVSVLAHPPVLYTGKKWLDTFYHHWFKFPEKTDVFFVPSDYVKHPEDRAVFQGSVDQLPTTQSFLDKPYQCKAQIEAHLEQMKISFHTKAIGVPHIIRVSYFPNWAVRGAHGVYPISPHFMMVIPRDTEVVLTYSRCFWELIGWALTGFTLSALFFSTVMDPQNRMSEFGQSLCLFFKKPLERFKPGLMALIIVSGFTLSILGAMHRNLPVRTYLEGMALYQKGIQLKGQMDLKEADFAFEHAIKQINQLFENNRLYDHQDVINCRLIIAKCYTQLKQYKAAHGQYDRIINEYPYCRYIAESHVQKSRLFRINRNLNMRTGISALKQQKKGGDRFLKQALKQTQKSMAQLKLAIKMDAFSHWASTAESELKEDQRIFDTIEKKLN